MSKMIILLNVKLKLKKKWSRAGCPFPLNPAVPAIY